MHMNSAVQSNFQPSFVPLITNDDINCVSDAVANGWGKNRDYWIKDLASSLARFLNVKYVLPVSSGTAAITTALASFGLKSGDEVIIPNLTWVACAAPIVQLGLVPVFLNVDSSLCIDPEELEKSISKKTRLIFAVDLAGSSPNWQTLITIAEKYNIPILEDAAESFGGQFETSINSKALGSFGKISILSFSPTKIITGGQGGAVCTNDEYLMKKSESLFHHGINPSKTGKYFWSDEIGYNFQITNMQSALISSQLSRITNIVNVRKTYYNLYEKYLEKSDFVSLYKYPSNVKSNYWMYLIIPKNKILVPKEQVLLEASKYGIDLRPFFYLLSDMPVYKQFYSNVNTYNRFLADYGVCLPYGYDLCEEKIASIVETIEKVYQQFHSQKHVF